MRFFLTGLGVGLIAAANAHIVVDLHTVLVVDTSQVVVAAPKTVPTQVATFEPATPAQLDECKSPRYLP